MCCGRCVPAYIPNLRQEHWPVPILPWYLCYTEQERHAGRGPIVVHDGLLTALKTAGTPGHVRQPLPGGDS